MLYISVFIVVSVLGYKVWALNSAMTILREAPLGNAVGPEDAKLIIVEFLDYRCSFCREVHPEMEAFLNKNTDIRVVFRHVPVLGKGSLPDIQLALAAGIQGKFMEAHNRLMVRDIPVDDDYIFVTAMDLDLDYDKLLVDMRGPEVGNFLLDNVDGMKLLNINSTPTFLIGDMVYMPSDHMPTAEDFEKLTEEALQ